MALLVAAVCRSTLSTRLFLLVAEQSEQRHTSNLDNLEAHTGQVTDRMSASSESGDENLIVFLDKVETSIARNKGSDLLAVLDELHTTRLSNGRVGLLGLDSDSFQNDSLCVRGATEGVGLEGGGGVLAGVLLVVPFLFATMGAQFAGAAHSRRLSVSHGVEA